MSSSYRITLRVEGPEYREEMSGEVQLKIPPTRRFLLEVIKKAGGMLHVFALKQTTWKGGKSG